MRADIESRTERLVYLTLTEDEATKLMATMNPELMMRYATFNTALYDTLRSVLGAR